MVSNSQAAIVCAECVNLLEKFKSRKRYTEEFFSKLSCTMGSNQFSRTIRICLFKGWHLAKVRYAGWTNVYHVGWSNMIDIGLDNSGWQGNLLVLLTILSSTLAQSKMIKSKAFEIILSLLLLSAKALNLNLRTSLQ